MRSEGPSKSYFSTLDCTKKRQWVLSQSQTLPTSISSSRKWNWAQLTFSILSQQLTTGEDEVILCMQRQALFPAFVFSFVRYGLFLLIKIVEPIKCDGIL